MALTDEGVAVELGADGVLECGEVDDDGVGIAGAVDNIWPLQSRHVQSAMPCPISHAMSGHNAG